MRLGKVQAAGYIEDTEATAAADAEKLVQPERTTPTPASDPDPVTPVVAVG